MANVPLHFTASLRDGLDTLAKITSYLLVPDSSGIAQVMTDLATWAAAVDACIDGAIVEVAARFSPSLPGGLKGATGATWQASRVEQTSTINFSGTGSDRRWGQALPSLRNTAIASGKINLSDTAIVALVTLLTDPANHFTNSENQALEAAVDAIISFRQRAQLPRTSFEV